MNKRILAAALCLAATSASAQVPPNILTPDYWRNFDWANVENSKVWNLPGFVDESEPNIGFFSKKMEVIIDKTDYRLNTMKIDSQGSKGRSISLNLISFPSTQCENYTQQYAAKFGGGFEKVDNTTIFAKDLAMYSQKSMKNVGNTLISISCNRPGNQGEDNGEYTSFAIAFSEQRPIKKPIALQCTRKIRFLSDGSSQPLPAFSFIFREDSKMVLGLDRVMIANTENQSPMEVSFKVRNKNLETLYTVNRSNGTLSGVVEDEGKFVANVEGACQLYSDNKLF